MPPDVSRLFLDIQKTKRGTALVSMSCSACFGGHIESGFGTQCERSPVAHQQVADCFSRGCDGAFRRETASRLRFERACHLESYRYVQGNETIGG